MTTTDTTIDDAATLLLDTDAPDDLLVLTAEQAFRRPTWQPTFDELLLYGLLPEGTAAPVDIVQPHPDAELGALYAMFEAWARLPDAAFTGRLY